MHKKSIMLEEFSKYLDDIIYPTQKEKHELWNISGVLKNRLNEPWDGPDIWPISHQNLTNSEKKITSKFVPKNQAAVFQQTSGKRK